VKEVLVVFVVKAAWSNETH